MRDRHAPRDGLRVRWVEKPWSALEVPELYALLALRQRVFVVEQNCPYLDCDGYDQRALHLWSLDDRGEVSSYSRLFGPGVKYPECSIGRVITAPEHRGTGLGRELVARSLAAIDARWPEASTGRAVVRISAQAHLQRFYGDFGFDGQGDTYLEDGIPHRDMVRR